MFIAIIILSIIAAWIVPDLGMPNALFDPSKVASWGVFVIFFTYGVKLSPHSLRVSLGNLRLHTLIQLTTFILFPLVILGAAWLEGGTLWNHTFDPTNSESQNTYYYIWLGVYFLSTLPSTISSSVVMVSLARGNVPAAIFNASIGSLAGVFLTPLLMSPFITPQTGGGEMRDIAIDLVIKVILPVGLGMLMNRRWGALARRFGKQLRMFDQAVIIAIVWTAFCKGFKGDLFNSVDATTLLILILSLAGLLVAAYALIFALTRIMKFNREDRITALFCGSKKSLIHGTVMSRVMFPTSAFTSIILLPIMLFHVMHLSIAGILAKKLRTSLEKAEQAAAEAKAAEKELQQQAQLSDNIEKVPVSE